jgi:hypothetical protein
MPHFKELQWLFPVAVALHNGEEAIWMPVWTSQHTAQLPVHPPEGTVICCALGLLTVAAFAVTYFSARQGKSSNWAYLLFGSIVTMWVNVFVPHIPATLLFHSYTPGVVTAVLINLPLMSVLAVQAMREKWVSGRKALVFAAGVPVAIGTAIVALFMMSRIIF